MTPLAQISDLEARLGRSLTQSELARAAATLADASSKIRTYTRQAFDPVTDQTMVVRGTAGEIRLPQRPVVSVSAVVALGAYGAPDFPLIDWAFDGIDIVKLGTGTGIINLPEAFWDEDSYLGTYRVTYSHGYASLPDAIVSKACEIALRVLTSPSMAGGVISETVGPYSYRLDAPGGGLSAVLTAGDKTDLEPWRSLASTTVVRR